MGKNLGLCCLVAVIVALLVCGIWAAGAYNRLNASERGVGAAWTRVESVCHGRADLVPGLVETLKGGASSKEPALEAVVAARASALRVRLDASSLGDPQAFAEFQQAQDALSSALSRLLAAAEEYPDLKATPVFRDLRAQLDLSQRQILVERGRFNEAVHGYNALRRSLPTVIVASFAGFKEKAYIHAAPGPERLPAEKP